VDYLSEIRPAPLLSTVRQRLRTLAGSSPEVLRCEMPVA